jgi:CTP synthase
MPGKEHKYIFVVGGVMSGVGKGITVASIGKILKGRGYKVNLIKVDPYLNVDAGTMNPTEHGEVFVLRSGLETDQDMGNYERFLEKDLTDDDYITSGMVYRHVIEKERNLGYRGKCVEAIPHITDEINRRFRRAAETNGSEISVIEVGGTIGDFQNALFIEAARVLKVKNPNDVIFVLVSYLPVPKKLGEMKTRPTQHAIRELSSYGVQADIIVGRSELPLDKRRKDKIAAACSVPAEHVISAPDIESIYDVPTNFERDKISDILLSALKLRPRKRTGDLAQWKRFLAKRDAARRPVKIAVVGKYFDTGDFVLSDSYVSVIEAIKFSSYAQGAKPQIDWLNAKDFENGTKVENLRKYDGIIVPGGFGETGIEGKIKAIRFAREKKIPYFGLCYGMQLAVVEYARHVAGLKGANTAEIDPKSPHLVVDVMPDQKQLLAEQKYGGTMRLGAYLAVLKKGTIARQAYRKELIEERHRHRYEINPEYIDRIEKAGLVFSGTSPDGKLMEIAELPRSVHPFFLGTQFHPEFQAHPLTPHPLFTEFIGACITRKHPIKKTVTAKARKRRLSTIAAS